jgi:hypothetical protein
MDVEKEKETRAKFVGSSCYYFSDFSQFNIGHQRKETLLMISSGSWIMTFQQITTVTLKSWSENN